MNIEEKWLEKFFKRFGHVNGIGIVVLIVWCPLMILSFLWSESPTLDLATHVRLLISLPLILLSYPYVLRKFDHVFKYFEDARMITGTDLDKLINTLSLLEEWASSKAVKIFIFVSIYLTSYIEYINREEMSELPWRSLDRPAGWWFYLVSEPAYRFVLLYFFLYTFLWWTLFYKISRLKLRLKPNDGDNVGGLGFLRHSLFTFLAPAFAISTAAAAGAGNLILYGKLTLEGLKMISTGFCSFLFILMTGPFFLFIPVLLKEREKSVHKHGVLSAIQLEQFNDKWLESKSNKADTLDTEDFSAVADFGSVVSRPHEMKLVPIRTWDMTVLALAICAPFLPVFSLEMPWKDIFQQIINVVR